MVGCWNENFPVKMASQHSNYEILAYTRNKSSQTYVFKTFQLVAKWPLTCQSVLYLKSNHFYDSGSGHRTSQSQHQRGRGQCRGCRGITGERQCWRHGGQGWCRGVNSIVARLVVDNIKSSFTHKFVPVREKLLVHPNSSSVLGGKDFHLVVRMFEHEHILGVH